MKNSDICIRMQSKIKEGTFLTRDGDKGGIILGRFDGEIAKH